MTPDPLAPLDAIAEVLDEHQGEDSHLLAARIIAVLVAQHGWRMP